MWWVGALSRIISILLLLRCSMLPPPWSLLCLPPYIWYCHSCLGGHCWTLRWGFCPCPHPHPPVPISFVWSGTPYSRVIYWCFSPLCLCSVWVRLHRFLPDCNVSMDISNVNEQKSCKVIIGKGNDNAKAIILVMLLWNKVMLGGKISIVAAWIQVMVM